MKAKSNYITPEQFKDILEYIPNLQSRKWSVLDIQYSMKIAYYCCLRYGSEVADRTKEDFNLEQREVYLGRTKTRKEDYAPIAPMFIPDLDAYLQHKKPLEPVLKDCDAQNMYLWLMKIGVALKIEAFLTPQRITGEKTKLHIFRKSFVKDMAYGTFNKKANIGQLQSTLRHRNPFTTGKYLRLDIEGSKEFWD